VVADNKDASKSKTGHARVLKTQRRKIPHLRHHDVFVFDDVEFAIPDTGLPWSGPTFVNVAVGGHHPDAADGHVVLIGQNEATMMIELIRSTRAERGFELLAAYEEALYDLGGRPHWGQVNTLTGSHDLVRLMYPGFAQWLEIHDQINSNGVFDSPFWKRTGISQSRYVPAPKASP
jgi:hypothetical protein